MAEYKQGEIGSIPDVHMEHSLYGGFVLTKKGSLLGAIELQGVDPDGLLPGDLEGLSVIARSFYQHLDPRVIVSQYFIHYDGAEIELADRDHPVSHLLSKRREAFINKKALSSARLVHFFEVMPSEKLSQLGGFDLIKQIVKAGWDKPSRDVVRRHFSSVESVTVRLQEANSQVNMLKQIMDDAVSRWEGIFNARQLNIDEIWSVSKFISNLETYYLDSYHGAAPVSGWDVSLSDGDKKPLDNMEGTVYRFVGTKPQYVRILAVNNLKNEQGLSGLWASAGSYSPVSQTGNFMICVRYQAYTRLEKQRLFSSKESDLNRRNYDLTGLISNRGGGLSEKDRRELMKPAVKKALDELGEAELAEGVWGKLQASVVVWSEDRKELRLQSEKMKRSLDRINIESCWEGVGQSRAVKAIQPAGHLASQRNIPANVSEFAAASLLFAPSRGQVVVPDLDGEEAQYIFVSDDGTPFHFSPFVNGRCVVIGIGPIRSGKSFTKNTLASHFLKYGGFVQGIDIDKGMEPVARSFGEDGRFFRLENSQDVGFNPFASLQHGVDDMMFIDHLRSLIMAMIDTNDTEEMRRITSEEQHALDHAIIATIKLSDSFHRLSTVVDHCPESLRLKLARWVHSTEAGSPDGIYSRYFDAEHDAIGSIDKRVMAYNLRSIKDKEKILALVMAEIFFRTSRAFEDIGRTDIPKYLDIDEAHAPLSIDYIADYVVRYIRTSGKYTGGIGLWSQNPKEFGKVKDWSVIRGAASTFFFMADPNMEEKEYKEIFKLTSGECEAIKNLRPKREAFIIQRDLGISKKVILEVEPEQRVVSTSKGSETKIRDQNFEELGFEDGLIKTMIDLEFIPHEEAETLLRRSL
ncbi:VirB4 family type IV secretion system protein [Methylophaga sp.]|uniref:VirB4 family type IV secretion system protein n=1 Tax=Methylophaga sp. TaxID=2024840 RepID=UPI003A9527BB